MFRHIYCIFVITFLHTFCNKSCNYTILIPNLCRIWWEKINHKSKPTKLDSLEDLNHNWRLIISERISSDLIQLKLDFWRSKGLGRIFKKFREIRQKSNWRLRNKQIFISNIISNLIKRSFLLASDVVHICNLIRRSFFVEIVIWSYPQARSPLPMSPINTCKFRGKTNDQAENRIDFCIGLT